MKRFRHLRIDQETRDKNVEVQLNIDDFIYPYFVVEGTNINTEISSLDGVYQLSIDNIIKDIKECLELGINKFLLFGVIDSSLKTENAEAALQTNNLVARTVSAIKKTYPKVLVITDVCLCGYTHHGHCGVIENNEVVNDKTLPLLGQMALTHALAGADFVAPSSMMDGQVLAIRKALDKGGLNSTKILGYSAKYASNFYGPFRDAADSTPSFGDRKTYQMDYRTSDQAIDEIVADAEEGADWIMVKPAHTYLDILYRAKQKFPNKKLAAYHVSGEYMLIKKAAEAGLLNEQAGMFEVLYALKRAGSDYLISYYAKEAARIIQGKLMKK